MTEETRPEFLANYKIVRPGPPRLGPQFKNSARARARPGPLRPGPVDTYIMYSILHLQATHATVRV